MKLQRVSGHMRMCVKKNEMIEGGNNENKNMSQKAYEGAYGASIDPRTCTSSLGTSLSGRNGCVTG